MVRFLSRFRRSGFLALLAAAALALAPLLFQPAPTAQAATSTTRVIELVNGYRARAGLAPLRYNANLTWAAQSYAQVLASGYCFGHYCGRVPSIAARIQYAGYPVRWTYGENIAAGSWTPEGVVAMWMASPGHRANIYNPYFREIGVGVTFGGPYGVYWTQVFAA